MILHKFRLNNVSSTTFLLKAISLSKLLFLLLMMTSLTVRAEWNLDQSKSSIEFISIKNNQISETHSFQKFSGSITSEGVIHLIIELDSVDTKIPIRDERMRNLFFETEMFPKATFSTKIPAEDLEIENEYSRIFEVNGRLGLHGAEAELNSKVMILNRKNALRVVTNNPILISAGDFNLTAGIAKLQKIAGLDSISAVVPVILDLIFIESET